MGFWAAVESRCPTPHLGGRSVCSRPHPVVVAVLLIAGLAGAPAIAGDAARPEPVRAVQPLVKELRLGALDHDTDLLTNGGDENGVDINVELVFAARTWPFQIPERYGRILPFAGITTQADGDTSDQLYGGLAWDILPKSPYLLRLGFGASLHDGNLEGGDGLELGRRILWLGTTEAGVRFMDHHSLSLYYQHSSNGPFSGSNEGINNAGIRYGFHF